jgi:parvulin-like peptidyl-prolyl isomerase
VTPAPLHRVLLAVAASILALTACGDAFRAPAAVVNGTDITDDQLESPIPLYQFLASLQRSPCGQPVGGESLQKACIRSVLSELVQQRIALDYAGHHGITVPNQAVDQTIRSLELRLGGRADLVRLLRKHGTTYAEFHGLVARLLLVRDVVRAIAAETIPENELRQRYEQERIQFTRLHVAHILVSTKVEAERVAREATPANFASLARTLSRDP